MNRLYRFLGIQKLSYEQRISWFFENYYESGMEYQSLRDSMKNYNLDNFQWYGEFIKIPKYENNICMKIFNFNIHKGELYEFLYNGCIHESSPVTISLHYTKKGAEKAMNEHKEKEYQKWLKYNEECIKSNPEFYEEYPNKFGEDQSWFIRSIKVLP